jgi:hypothetical protein
MEITVVLVTKDCLERIHPVHMYSDGVTLFWEGVSGWTHDRPMSEVRAIQWSS